MNQPWYIHALYTVIRPFLKDKTRKRVRPRALLLLDLCSRPRAEMLASFSDLHAREQPEQPPPADPPRDLAVGARRDDAPVRHGHVGEDAAGPRLRRGHRLLPRVLHAVGARPGARPGQKHVPQDDEEVSSSCGRNSSSIVTHTCGQIVLHTVTHVGVPAGLSPWWSRAS